MSGNHGNTRIGGFEIKSGGDTTLKAGGNMVAGDMHVTATDRAFKDTEDRERFAATVEEIRSALREIKVQIESAAHLDQDQKDDLSARILSQITDLKNAKENASRIPAGPAESSSEPARTAVEKSLETTTGILRNVQSVAEGINDVGDKAIKIGETIGPIVARLLPLIASARHLFGLP
jgi:hypothetical protein